MAESGSQAFTDAVAHHQAGRKREAEMGYRAVLAAEPDHPHANHNLGVMALLARQAPAALPFLKRALDADRRQPQFWVTYVSALAHAGQMDAARDALSRARDEGIAAEAFDRLARQLNDPLGLLRDEVAANPTSAAAHNNLGAALKALGHNEEAAESFRRAIELRPELAGLHGNLGGVLDAMGRSEEALVSLRRAVELDPQLAQVHSSLGQILRSLGRIDDALASYRRAVQVKPDFAEA